MSNKKKPLLSAFASAMIIITLLLTVFNIAAWHFPSFMDVYHRIYAPAATFISRLPGLFPFSVGEILIAAAVIISVLSIVLTVISAVKKNKGLCKAVSRTMTFILVFIYFTETCNCFVLFHTTELTQRLAHYAAPEGYSTETLVELCRSMIKEANELALVVERDSDGNVIPPADLSAAAENAFSVLYEDIPELKGYCATPKKMIASTLMTQMDLQGVYFPFTLEGNYNGYISPAHVPTTTFHEIAHIKGFIREDEATFLSCAACFSSDIPEVRYSGCIETMNYLFKECRKYADEEQIYSLRSELTIQVAKDNYFVSEEHMKKAEKSVIPKDKVNAVHDAAMETTLKANGVKDGSNSYNRMVTLFLIWYYRDGA